MYPSVATIKNGTKNQFGEFEYTHSIKINHIRMLVPARNPGIITSPKVQMVASQMITNQTGVA